MQAYIYCADIYCEECAEQIKRDLDAKGLTPENPENESTFDSDNYPKGPYSDGGGEADYPSHCGSREDCVNAIELSDGHKIGDWLENDLTAKGIEYVREAIAEGGEVSELWAEWYSDVL